MKNPFDDGGGGKPPDDRPRRVGLAAPRPLSSAELEAKYGTMNHGGIELAWPVRFESDKGEGDPLTDHDMIALKHLGVSVEEYLEVELLREEFPALELEDALAAVRAK
jgi:hypothetical protein